MPDPMRIYCFPYLELTSGVVRLPQVMPTALMIQVKRDPTKLRH